MKLKNSGLSVQFFRSKRFLRRTVRDTSVDGYEEREETIGIPVTTTLVSGRESSVHVCTPYYRGGRMASSSQTGTG